MLRRTWTYGWNAKEPSDWLATMCQQYQRIYLYKEIYSLLSALAFLHRKIDGLVTSHYDLKPKNILVNKKTLRICNFGRSHLLSLEKSSETEGRSGLGTFTYHLPEYWNLDGTHTSKPHGRAFDVWAIGCIMIEMLILVCYGWRSEKVSSFQKDRSANTGRTKLFDHPTKQGAADDSFHNNMDVVYQWIARIRKEDGSVLLNQFLDTAIRTLSPIPEARLYSW